MRFISMISSFLGLLLSCFAVHATNFNLTSNAFLDGGILPVLYTCDSKDISPALNWENAPKNTKSFVLILSDNDAEGGVFYHWVLFNLPASISQLDQGIKKFPPRTKLIKNSWNKMQYNGPCPPKGTSHHYVFTLYALDTLLKIREDSSVVTLLQKINNHILEKTELTGIYNRWLVLESRSVTSSSVV